jgi:hypothetical protein
MMPEARTPQMSICRPGVGASNAYSPLSSRVSSPASRRPGPAEQGRLRRRLAMIAEIRQRDRLLVDLDLPHLDQSLDERAQAKLFEIERNHLFPPGELSWLLASKSAGTLTPACATFTC